MLYLRVMSLTGKIERGEHVSKSQTGFHCGIPNIVVDTSGVPQSQ